MWVGLCAAKKANNLEMHGNFTGTLPLVNFYSGARVCAWGGEEGTARDVDGWKRTNLQRVWHWVEWH